MRARHWAITAMAGVAVTTYLIANAIALPVSGWLANDPGALVDADGKTASDITQ